jgi:hypothetical protein
MSKDQIDLKTTLVRSSQVVASEIDGETVVMDIDSGNCYAIDGNGCRIWRMLASPISLKDLILSLMRDFDVYPETCENDVLRFVYELSEKGFLGAPSNE